MKSRLAILRELRRVEKVLKRTNLSVVDSNEQYGAAQALGWVLDMNCMAPSKMAGIGTK